VSADLTLASRHLQLVEAASLAFLIILAAADGAGFGLSSSRPRLNEPDGLEDLNCCFVSPRLTPSGRMP
jgi:hypothetical protein